MTKHPSARRVHRSANDEDTFVTGVLESSVWAKEHGRTLVIAGVVAFLVLGGLLYFRSYRATMADKAASELSAVRSTVQSGNLQLAKQDLQKFVNTYGGTAAGGEGKLLLAQTQLQTNEAPKAIETLDGLADDPESPMGYNAALMLAAAHEAAKKPADAERVLLRVADKARFDFQKREALERAARIRAETGNIAGAIELYERVIATYEGTDQQETGAERNVYEMRLAELRSQGAPAGKS